MDRKYQKLTGNVDKSTGKVEELADKSGTFSMKTQKIPLVARTECQ